MPSENRFSIKMMFDSSESVVFYTYNFYVDSVLFQFENRFVYCIISNLSNEAIPISPAVMKIAVTV